MLPVNTKKNRSKRKKKKEDIKEKLQKKPIFESNEDKTVQTKANSVNGKQIQVPISIQAKLTVGSPDDAYEREADAMADKVVQRLEMPEQKKADPLFTHVTPLIQPKREQQKDDLQKKPIFESKAGSDEYLQRRCRECEEGPEVFLKPESFLQRNNVNDNAPTADGSRESIIATARTMLGKIESKHDDGTGKRVGAEYLLEIFHLAAPGVWDDATIENSNGQIPSWCGIFAVWAHKKAGKDIGTWQMGKGVSAFGTLTQTTSPQVGDIGYIDQPYQHHCIVVKVEGDTVHSIDGNSGLYSEVKENQKPLSEYTGFFTAFGAGSEASVQRKEDNSISVQAKAGDTTSTPDSIEQQLSALKGSGSALPETVRSGMEQNFGADFSGVKIHTDSSAVQMSKDLHAQAFTHGSDIYFNAGKYAPGSSEGKHLLTHELTHVLQQGSKIGNKNDLLQRELFDKRTNRQKIDDALTSKDSDDIDDIDNFGEATEQERLSLIRIIHNNDWIGPTDEGNLEKIWRSFVDLPKVASANIDLFKKSVEYGAELEKFEVVKNARHYFAYDVTDLARKYLKLNRAYTEEELESLGLAKSEKSTQEDKAEAMAELKIAAGLVKKAQEGQAIMKGMRIAGKHVKIYGGGRGIGGVAPAVFDPESAPSIDQREAGEENTPTWAETKKQYDRLTNVILGLSNRYPAIYALVRDEKIAEFANSDSSKALSIVSDSLHSVIKYIDLSGEKIDSGDISYYDLVPIHTQLFEGSKEGFSKIKWNEEFYKWAAESDIAEHESKEFWIQLGLTTLAAAAFIVAELATFGTATFAIAAGIGIGIGVGQAAYSWERYRDLAAASKANVTDETALVSQGQASAALVEAVINTVFAFLDIFGPAAKGLKGVAKVGEGVAEVGAKTGAKTAKNVLEEAEKELAEKTTKEMAERKAAEQLGKQVVEKGGKSISRTVLEFMGELLKGFMESVKKWATFVFDKLGFKSYEVIDEGEFLVLYGIRSRVRLARFRKDSIQKFIVDSDSSLATKIGERNSQLAKSRIASKQGDEMLANALRKSAIDFSEEIGEEAAMKVIAEKFPGAVFLHRGSGSGTLDLIYKLSTGEFLIVEAKGGAGRLGSRDIGGGVRAQQGLKSYLRSVAEEMAEKEGQQKVANELIKAINQNKVKYAFSKTPIPRNAQSIIETMYKEFVLQ